MPNREIELPIARWYLLVSDRHRVFGLCTTGTDLEIGRDRGRWHIGELKPARIGCKSRFMVVWLLETFATSKAETITYLEQDEANRLLQGIDHSNELKLVRDRLLLGLMTIEASRVGNAHEPNIYEAITSAFSSQIIIEPLKPITNPDPKSGSFATSRFSPAQPHPH